MRRLLHALVVLGLALTSMNLLERGDHDAQSEAPGIESAMTSDLESDATLVFERATERLRPAVERACEGSRAEDGDQIDRALGHLATFDPGHLAEAEVLMKNRIAARRSGQLVLSDGARRIAAELQTDSNPIVLEVVRALL
ncbi:hypothetical protein [Engelhardtia mirabilis]|uniref:Uncharacterized protein n=1 Tax=Engelhardtia mirabilis TaxID=2528011 RepID=A0A518BEB4_9BACT|nr:hypothetical protein Pla133_03710 [Planctomycetes bacterium Pla133]QDU99632.1 hypothetical protein Pla86_03710 [Planctomycetes bacterium Pla86]